MVAPYLGDGPSSDVFGPLPTTNRPPTAGAGPPAHQLERLGLDSDGPADGGDDDGACDDDDLFEATQTGPATQPQSLPNGTPQGEAIDHWGRLVPINQPNTDPLLLYYTKAVYRVGRNAACDFVFDKEARVSNSHAAFHLSESDPSGPLVLIEDLKSSNGTYVNGQKLVPHRKRVLKHGDDIWLGMKPSSAKAGAAAAGGLNTGVRLMFITVTKRATEKCEIFDKYHIGEKIGSGTFADVKRGMNIETGELVAIKEIQKHKFMSNPKTMQLFEREIQILGALSHPSICHFIEYFESDTIIYLVLEYVDGGNLLDYIMAVPHEGGMDEQLAVDITRQICVGMAYCHKMLVTHRDLKPENVLLTQDDPPLAKIADFGLAKMIESSGATMLKSMVGTPQYLAPEVVLHEKGVGYGQAVDSWSVGIIVYAMLTKLLPFSEDKDDPIEVKLAKRAKERVDYSPFDDFGVSGIARDFVGRLLTIDPKTRMSLETALAHPWLRQTTFASPSALGDGAVPTVTSLNRTEPTTAKTERSSGAGYGGDGDTARPSAPPSRFSSSSSPTCPMDEDGVRLRADGLPSTASVAVEMDSSAPDGKAPPVVHPPIFTRPAPQAPAAVAPADRKRKHSPSPSAAPAPLDVFSGSSSLSSIGAEPTAPAPRSTVNGGAAPNGRHVGTPPARQSPRLLRRTVEGGDDHAPAGPSTAGPAPPTSLRRSTRRRTTSPSRATSEDGHDGADEPSPAKRAATGTTRPSARSTRRRS